MKGDVHDSTTTYIHFDVGKKKQMGMKQQKGNGEVLPDSTPREALTFAPLSAKKASDDELHEDAIEFAPKRNGFYGCKL